MNAVTLLLTIVCVGLLPTSCTAQSSYVTACQACLNMNNSAGDYCPELAKPCQATISSEEAGNYDYLVAKVYSDCTCYGHMNSSTCNMDASCYWCSAANRCGTQLSNCVAPPSPQNATPRAIPTGSQITPSVASNAANASTVLSVIIVGSVVIVFVVAAVIILVRRRAKHRRTTHAESLPNDVDMETLNNCVNMLDVRQLTFDQELGSGAYGTVYKGRYEKQDVAIKIATGVGSAHIVEFLQEVDVMVKLTLHPNVLQVHGMALRNGQPLMVLAYMPLGSLDTLLNKRALTNQELKRIACGTCSGLAHLAEASIVHRDVSARNILLNTDMTPVVADFGMARTLADATAKGQTKTSFGPVPWMAPENFDLSYSEKSDVWSFGCLLYEMLTRSAPHDDYTDLAALAVAIKTEHLTPTLPENCAPEWHQVTALCWQRDPATRPTFVALLQYLQCI